jgi:hypothetical protein
MMPSKNRSSSGNAGKGASKADIVALYDALMEQIEPDLVSTEIDYLDTYYSGETEEESAARAERYAKAFILFEERMGQLFVLWEKELAAIKEKVLTQAKSQSAKQEHEEIEGISSAIDKA